MNRFSSIPRFEFDITTIQHFHFHFTLNYKACAERILSKEAIMDGPNVFVANKDAPVAILQQQILSSKSPEDKEKSEKKLKEIMTGRELVRYSIHQIAEKCTDSAKDAQQLLDKRSKAYNTKEYKEVVEYYREKCFDWHDTKYNTALQHLYIFANLLEEKVPVNRIKGAIDEVEVLIKEEMKKDVEKNTATMEATAPPPP